jgi:anti-sigma-K factor RskA
MSDAFDHSALPDDELLAAVYALGVLSGAERAAAEQRVARDRGFARLVAEWEQRLAPWAAEIPDILPPPQVWDRIAGALPAPTSAGLWENLAFWRIFALGSALAAACLVAFVYLTPLTQGPSALAATLEGDGQRTFFVTIDRERAHVTATPLRTVATGNRVPELWLIAPNEKPVSIGLLNPGGAAYIMIPARAIPKAEYVLAVSLEPPGGSPTGQPTGPVIATGKLTSL